MEHSYRKFSPSRSEKTKFQKAVDAVVNHLEDALSELSMRSASLRARQPVLLIGESPDDIRYVLSALNAEQHRDWVKTGNSMFFIGGCNTYDGDIALGCGQHPNKQYLAEFFVEGVGPDAALAAIRDMEDFSWDELFVLDWKNFDGYFGDFDYE